MPPGGPVLKLGGVRPCRYDALLQLIREPKVVGLPAREECSEAQVSLDGE